MRDLLSLVAGLWVVVILYAIIELWPEEDPDKELLRRRKPPMNDSFRVQALAR